MANSQDGTGLQTPMKSLLALDEASMTGAARNAAESDKDIAY